jgi:circadian clock protein KaiC
MKSIGIDLGRWTKKGLLQIHASRPTLQGLEQHLVFMYDEVHDFAPDLVVVDPISNLGVAHEDAALRPTLMRLIDFLKQRHVTAVFTSLVGDSGTSLAESQVGVSSLMDTWLLLSNLEANGERTRTLQVIKSRGMPHSNQVREFVFGADGVDLIDVYVADDQVLTGRRRVGAQRIGRGASVLKAGPARRRAKR